jgi:molecular chaperone DnaK
MGVVIGIDLGTTYSAAGWVVEGKPEILMLEGEPTLPSVISRLRSGNIAIGRAAKRNQTVAPHDTIVEVKRQMGNNVQVPLGDKKFTPQELSMMILKKIKEEVEKQLPPGETVAGVVISCPAYFKNPARDATKEAGQLAGMKVLQIVNEPTAAAYAYGVQHAGSSGLFLVYDLGGGTFDVTVIKMTGSNLDVLGTGGDPHLGGGNFDDRIVEWMLECLEKKNPGYRASITDDKSPALKLRLKAYAEEGKKKVCDAAADAGPDTDRTTIKHVFNIPQVDQFQGKPLPFTETLTLAKFEELIDDLLQNSLKWIDEAFKVPAEKHKYAEKDLTAVLLVGGSTRVPAVRRLLEKRFAKTNTPIWGREKGINPDEIVALGASLVAISADPDSDEVPQKVLVDVTGHTLNVAVYDESLQREVLSPIIMKESRIPCKKEHRFQSAGKGQRHCLVQVFQGEGREVTGEGVMKIGEFVIEIAPIEAPTPLRVGLTLDQNGILIGHAIDELSGREVKCELTYQGKAKMSEEELALRQKSLEDQLAAVLGGSANPLDGPKPAPAQQTSRVPPSGNAAAAAAPPPPPAGAQVSPSAGASPPPASEAAAQPGDVTALMNPVMRSLYNKAVNNFANIPEDRQQKVIDLLAKIEDTARTEPHKLMSYLSPLNQLLQGVG